ncbi:AAA family ATPase [candidate division WWE3 bacterium]|nr:AAA family ATPase [candidate division WWE3 bacterium]
MKIKRYSTSKIMQSLSPKRAAIIYGPRRVGKTTLLNSLKEQLEETTKASILSVTGEDRFVSEWLGSQSIEVLKRNLESYNYLFIDEAQHINKIGLNIKLIVDNIPDVVVVATGSSSFSLANQIGEPLVGRKWQYLLYPFAQLELNSYENPLETRGRLEERLIFGSYPEIVLAPSLDAKMQILNSIVDNYLFRDLLILEDLRRSDKLLDLLKLLAFQIGNEVSISALANSLNLSFHTVEKYLFLLEEVFVIKRVGGFSRNLRKEVIKNSRYYFLDNGVRNAVINNFNDLGTRDDVGMLWENYLFVERLKKREYLDIYANHYFWRTYDQKEIDLIEERDGKLYGFEFKWGSKEPKAPRDWLGTYDNATYEVMNKGNYLDFIT